MRRKAIGIGIFIVMLLIPTTAQAIGYTGSPFASPLVLGFIVVTIIILIIGIWCARRREAQPAVRYEKILPYPG